MKFAQLAAGKTYENKQATVFRTISSIGRVGGKNQVYYRENGYICCCPGQEFAEWAARQSTTRMEKAKTRRT